MQILCVFCIGYVLDMQLIIVIGPYCFACPNKHFCFFVFCFLFLFLFFFFFFFFLGSDSKGIVRSGLITVLRTVRLNRDSNGSLLFWHRPVLKLKRTVIVRGSRFSCSNCTVRSGFQNLENKEKFQI